MRKWNIRQFAGLQLKITLEKKSQLSQVTVKHWKMCAQDTFNKHKSIQTKILFADNSWLDIFWVESL